MVTRSPTVVLTRRTPERTSQADPTLATVAPQRAEFGWRWTLFGLGLQLGVAWILATLVFQIGRLL